MAAGDCYARGSAGIILNEAPLAVKAAMSGGPLVRFRGWPQRHKAMCPVARDPGVSQRFQRRQVGRPQAWGAYFRQWWVGTGRATNVVSARCETAGPVASFITLGDWGGVCGANCSFFAHLEPFWHFKGISRLESPERTTRRGTTVVHRSLRNPRIWEHK
jgi:hypothetical protein